MVKSVIHPCFLSVHPRGGRLISSIANGGGKADWTKRGEFIKKFHNDGAASAPTT